MCLVVLVIVVMVVVATLGVSVGILYFLLPMLMLWSPKQCSARQFGLPNRGLRYGFGNSKTMFSKHPDGQVASRGRRFGCPSKITDYQRTHASCGRRWRHLQARMRLRRVRSIVLQDCATARFEKKRMFQTYEIYVYICWC